MYKEREATKVTNRRIASKLHQVFLIIKYKFTYVNKLLFKLKVYSLAVENRGLIVYDDKRVLLANLDNGEPNPYTHDYGNYSLANEVRVQDAEEQPDAENDLQIESRAKKEKARLQRKHALAIKRARRTQPEDISDDEAEVQGHDLVLAQQAAVARPVPSIRMNTVIERICARDHLERHTSPPLRMPPPPSPQRAGKLLLLNAKT